MTDKTKPEGLAKYPRATEDDVEGHSFRHVTTTDGLAKHPRATEDDVEGHSFRHVTTTDGLAKHPRATEDDDVEGHSLLDPMAARELARARERDVQQHAKRHEFERDARDAKKDR
jgi:hypothetical protein